MRVDDVTQKLLNPAAVDQKWINAILANYQKKGGLRYAFRAAAAMQGWSPVTCTYISDNGGYPDTAGTEIELNLADIDRVIAALSGETPPTTIYRDVPAQDWRAAAFDLAQTARYRLTGTGNIIFANCAPRLGQRGVETNNKGEAVYIAMLPNGTVVSATSPHSFAFMRDLIESGDLEIYEVNVQTDGSQFRSLDYFPWYAKISVYVMTQEAKYRDLWCAGMTVEQRKQLLGNCNFVDTKKILALKDIPDLSKKIYIARVDTHGNLKLSISRSDVPKEWEGRTLNVIIKGQHFPAEIRGNMFDTTTGNRGIAPGSSGRWPDSKKNDPRFLEIALMGASLRHALDITDQDLKEGVEVLIQPVAVEQDNRLASGARLNGQGAHPEPVGVNG